MNIRTHSIRSIAPSDLTTMTSGCVQVSEMRAEYFPPKADTVLQKVTSTDCYIIVSGAAVSTQ